jgi:triosephosphate isomerase
MTDNGTHQQQATGRSGAVSDLWIGTSWKMNKTLGEARAWIEGLLAGLPGIDPATAGSTIDGVQPFVIPSFTATTTARELLGDPASAPALLGVQNAHWEDKGAWTGEVSVPQAKDAGAQIVEIGHSERREFFGETVETTRLKVRATLDHGLTPLLCIGESAEVKDARRSAEFILSQATGALEGLSAQDLARVVIAYEPIWAIGEKGRPATVPELTEQFDALGERYGDDVAGLLYGGSVNLGNAEELLGIAHVTGLFVGRTAWEIDGYLQLLRIAAAHVRG